MIVNNKFYSKNRKRKNRRSKNRKHRRKIKTNKCPNKSKKLQEQRLRKFSNKPSSIGSWLKDIHIRIFIVTLKTVGLQILMFSS